MDHSHFWHQPSKSASRPMLIRWICLSWKGGFWEINFTIHTEKQEQREREGTKGRAGSVREPLTRHKAADGHIGSGRVYPSDLSAMDSHCNCKALWCSDKLTSADRALHLYFRHWANGYKWIGSRCFIEDTSKLQLVLILWPSNNGTGLLAIFKVSEVTCTLIISHVRASLIDNLINNQFKRHSGHVQTIPGPALQPLSFISTMHEDGCWHVIASSV